ncbi:MAG: Glu-tRNA(Gln) amidotransferase subunit GatE [Candidatus Thermoplasmatota archaeon]
MTETHGLRVGLEIHQQLSMPKLFCACPSELDDAVEARFTRRLHPTRSEMGDVDRAAVREHEKGLRFRYLASHGTCLVEADEEPPHAPNPQAIKTALILALMLDAKPVNEMHFMRKIVIDGSNTAGFQRTALVALDGRLRAGDREIRIPTISLEEDAARRMGEAEGEVVYKLDRLGIPLVEISTEPEIDTPEMARDVALAIGGLLRDTRRVRRGIGTIREDLNISVPGGARVEIKGVQELEMISVYVKKEVERQESLLRIARELRARSDGAVCEEPREITDLFAGTGSQLIKEAMERGERILGMRLKGFRGLLGAQEGGGKGLGPDLAAHARTSNIKGILHSDELPGYGITGQEVERVVRALGIAPLDAFVLLAAEEEEGRRALRHVAERAKAAFNGVPEETRDPMPDGTTNYSRPLPGEARMYPETDVPPVPVTSEMLERLRAHLPEQRERRIERCMTALPGSNQQMIEQMIAEEREDIVFEIYEKLGKPEEIAGIILSTILYDPCAGGVEVEYLIEVLSGLLEHRYSKEAIPTLLRYRAEHPDTTVDNALDHLGMRAASPEEIARIVEEVVRERSAFVRERGEKAFSPLMGLVMKRLRGRADGRVVGEALQRAIQKMVGSGN